jgi:3-deoxy-D-manno-octulosonic-acid transferase
MGETPDTPVGFHLYRLLAAAATPVLAFYIQSRVRSGREDSSRWVERWGNPVAERPEGPLIWFHAASVGECAVALPILRRCLEVRK